MLTVVTTMPEGAGVWVRSRRFRPIVVPYGPDDFPDRLLEPDRAPVAAQRSSPLVCITARGLTVAVALGLTTVFAESRRGSARR